LIGLKKAAAKTVTGCAQRASRHLIKNKEDARPRV
jgi:hypothetical protein